MFYLPEGVVVLSIGNGKGKKVIERTYALLTEDCPNKLTDFQMVIVESGAITNRLVGNITIAMALIEADEGYWF